MVLKTTKRNAYDLNVQGVVVGSSVVFEGNADLLKDKERNEKEAFIVTRRLDWRLLVLVAIVILAAANPGMVAAKTLTFAQSGGITSLETVGMQPRDYPAGYEAAFAIYNGLIKFNDDLEFEPDLATEWWVEDDGVAWTFILREGVQFHDGTPFNSEAVVSAYNGMINPEVNIGAYTLWAPIKEIIALDDFRVQITTHEPYGGLLNVLAHGSAGIPSPAAVEKYGEDYSLNPVGTGPYKVKEFDPGTRLTLVRNEDYFGGYPDLSEVNFRRVSDPSARIAALQSGQVDVIDAVPVEMVDMLLNTPNVDVIIRPGLQIFGLALNLENEFLQDQNVRQAMNYAVNKEAIVNVLFRGKSTILTSPLAPNTTGYNNVGSYEYDVEKAKGLLSDSGWVLNSQGVLVKDGKTLSLTLRTPEGAYPNDVLVAEVLQDQLKALGMDVEIEKVERATFWDGLKVPADKATYDMVIWGYNPSHADGHIQLEALFGTNPSRDANPPQWNYIWYSNEKVDELLADAKRSIDLEQRTQILGEAQQIIWEEAPYLWLYVNSIITAKRSDVEGVSVLPVVFTQIHNATK